MDLLDVEAARDDSCLAVRASSPFQAPVTTLLLQVAALAQTGVYYLNILSCAYSA